jgi:uncharacterized protein YfeS
MNDKAKLDAAIEEFHIAETITAQHKQASSNILEVVQAEDYASAKFVYNDIIESMREFETRLDDEHEIFLSFASFGKELILAVTHISYIDPAMIVFDGMVKGEKSRLIQNVSGLNFLMVASPIEQASPRRVFVAGIGRKLQ